MKGIVGVSMRRIYSILALLAIVYPVASPLWANAMEPQHAAMCHRMAMGSASASSQPSHHCHDMSSQDMSGEDDSAQNSSTPSFSANSSEECPMNCCVQSVPPTVAALPASSSLPLLVATEASRHVVPVAFTSVGFSSHTDRGPPSL